MQSFKDYIVASYKRKNDECVCSEFKFNHKVKSKRDKKSEVLLRLDCINVTVRLCDKDMETLYTVLISFENNKFKTCSARDLGLSEVELEIRFMMAKKDICKVITDEYNEKKKDIEDKLRDMSVYVGSDKDITPSEFKGESIKIIDSTKAEPPVKVKKEYDV